MYYVLQVFQFTLDAEYLHFYHPLYLLKFHNFGLWLSSRPRRAFLLAVLHT
jgi:hypothetical protein